jgi:lysozyme
MKIGVAPKAPTLSGTYHYYRPNENSLEQATLLLKRFRKGFASVLDIERLPEYQSVDRLKIGLKMVDSGRGPL